MWVLEDDARSRLNFVATPSTQRSRPRGGWRPAILNIWAVARSDNSECLRSGEDVKRAIYRSLGNDGPFERWYHHGPRRRCRRSAIVPPQPSGVCWDSQGFPGGLKLLIDRTSILIAHYDVYAHTGIHHVYPRRLPCFQASSGVHRVFVFVSHTRSLTCSRSCRGRCRRTAQGGRGCRSRGRSART